MKGFRRRLRLPLRIHAVRTVDIGDLLDVFLVSAVATILIIRLQLWLTNYPQLSPGKLHIAHLLWGGVGMCIALIMLLGFLGRSLRTPAAVIGGAGFGFFIDELGKFITSDNDYFYKPAAGIIYIVFVVLFLATRRIETRRGFTEREYLVNAIDLVMEAARHDLDQREKERALSLLDRADQRSPLVEPLRRLLNDIDAIPPREPRRLTRWALAARDRYMRTVEEPWFPKLITGVFAAMATLYVLQVVLLVFDVVGGADDELSFINIANLGSSLVAAVLVWAGITQLGGGSRLDAYRLFERALLVNIFITQVFAFVESQFTAVFGCGLAILLLVTVRNLQREERELLDARARTPAPATVEPRSVPVA